MSQLQKSFKVVFTNSDKDLKMLSFFHIIYFLLNHQREFDHTVDIFLLNVFERIILPKTGRFQSQWCLQ